MRTPAQSSVARAEDLLASNFPAQFLIEYAYDIRDTFPLPDWASSNEFRFDYTPGQGVPDIFEATEAQLGLKLIPGKAPVESVVVDRIAKPSAN
jgi:hypothetical protein